MNARDAFAGVLLSSFGAWFAWTSWRELALGTVAHMGPGFFPLALGLILVCFGGLLVVTSFTNRERGRLSPPPWRSVTFVSLAPILFAASVRDAGLIPATMVCAGCATLARPMPLLRRLLLSVGLGVSCAVIFHYGLGLAYPLFGNSRDG